MLPPITLNEHAPNLSDILITPLEVTSTLQQLNTGKASGPDNINNIVLKELSNELAHPLASLFNYSLRTGKFPKEWKTANVCAIHKKERPTGCL